MTTYDVLVVGGGFSGMRAAIAAKSSGANVALVSALYPLRSHSSGTQSGINAALNQDDSTESHLQDTLEAGAGLVEQGIASILCEEAVSDVISLEHMGVLFNRDDAGRIKPIRFSGSSQPRTSHSADSLGHIVIQVLYEQLLRVGVTTFDEWIVTNLLVDDQVCYGVIAQQLSTGRLHLLRSKTVILAAGGIGRMYEPNTSGFNSTADGIALAYMAGVDLMDMEFTQYHPTTLSGRGLVITETARSIGGHLINTNGHRFMDAYNPDTMDLTPRDTLARCIKTELDSGRGQYGHIFLDLRHLDAKDISEGLPETKFLVKKLTGIDASKDLIPITPAMHRPIGGIRVNQFGETSLVGLYATGENSCNGAHGANLIGGNSMADSIVFGRRTGEAAARYAQPINDSTRDHGYSLLENEERTFKAMTPTSNSKDTLGSIRLELADVMNEHVGIFRDGSGLSKAQSKIAELTERFSLVSIGSPHGPYNPSFSSYLGLKHMLDVSSVIVACALGRQESRGTHFRTDYPEREDKEWKKHSIASYSDNGPSVVYKDVGTS